MTKSRINLSQHPISRSGEEGRVDVSPPRRKGGGREVNWPRGKGGGGEGVRDFTSRRGSQEKEGKNGIGHQRGKKKGEPRKVAARLQRRNASFWHMEARGSTGRRERDQIACRGKEKKSTGIRGKRKGKGVSRARCLKKNEHAHLQEGEEEEGTNPVVFMLE